MKTILSLIVIAVTAVGYAQAQFSIPVPPEWKVTLQAVNESGQPVAGAQAEVESIKPGTSDEAVRVDGNTDTNGLFTATGRSWGRLYLHMTKAGYYSANKLYDIGVTDKTRYEPWNPTITLPLKKIINPIPMYAKRLNTHVPDLDKPIGFDLMAGDWVAPYGKGVNADIIFTGHFDKRTDGESDFTLTVNFPKAGDGIQEFTVPDAEKGSGLLSSHKAPAGVYQTQWVQTDNRKPDKPVETNRDPNRNYFFRVRTKLDESGNVVSAHYGKIYGDFMQFSYYLNPTPNDRNVEFDPKQNLMKGLGGLRSTELRVTAP